MAGKEKVSPLWNNTKEIRTPEDQKNDFQTPLPRKTFQYARIQIVIIELEKGYKGAIEFKVFDFPK